MDIRLGDTRSESGRWITAYVNGRAELGAHFDRHPPEGAPLITIFWCGVIGPGFVRHTIDRLSHLDAFGEDVTATVTSYGVTRSSMRLNGWDDLTTYLQNDFPMCGYPAYRAELLSKSGYVVFWANVQPSRRGNLPNAEENIGIAVPPNLLHGDVVSLIIQTIRRTTEIVPPIIREVLEAISRALDEDVRALYTIREQVVQ